MFLHLGGNKAILKKEVIAILDNKVKLSGATDKFLDLSSVRDRLRAGRMPTLLEDCPTKTVNISNKRNSIILTDKEIYISPISCATLKKRYIMSISDL